MGAKVKRSYQHPAFTDYKRLYAPEPVSKIRIALMAVAWAIAAGLILGAALSVLAIG